MKIKLISPAVESGFNHLNFYRDCGKAFFASPGSLTAVAAFTPKWADIEIIDENVEKLDFNSKVDLVGVGITNSYMAPKAYKIASAYRQKGVTVIFGGLHTSLFPKECLRHADAIVIGEAEDLWEKVVSDFKRHKLKKVYKCKKRPSLENRPTPRWDLIKLNSYDAITINATRGCPYSCKFCLIKMHMGNKIRQKPVEDVIKEVTYVRDNFRRKNIWFVDPNFTADKEYAKRLMKALIPLKIKYYCFSNIDVYKDKELLELMSMSGCYALSVGVESVDYRNIADVDKGVTNIVSEYTKALEEIRHYGIDWVANFMVGNKFDNEKTFKDLAKFIEENDIVYPCIFPAWVYPCTCWHDEIKNDDDAKRNEFNFFDYGIMNPISMDKMKFWMCYAKLFHDVYSYKSTFKRYFRLLRKRKDYRTRFMRNLWHCNSFFGIISKLIRRMPRATIIGIRARSIWAGFLALLSYDGVSFVAWQQIVCSKNFLIAYCNTKVEDYSKEPVASLETDQLLRTVKKLIKST